MSLTIKLPDLKCTARRNFCSSVIGASNRVFAVYQVDDLRPFWVMEMDHVENYTLPLRGSVAKFASHIVAIEHLSKMAISALGGDDANIYWPSRHEDTPSLDNTFHRIEMAA